MTSELIKIGTSGMFLLNSRFSSSSLLWDIWIPERFRIKNVLFWGDETQIRAFFLFFHIVSVSFLLFWVGVGWVVFFFCASFLISTTCQVGHFDSHTFIENLVLTGGRYIVLPAILSLQVMQVWIINSSNYKCNLITNSFTAISMQNYFMFVITQNNRLNCGMFEKR